MARMVTNNLRWIVRDEPFCERILQQGYYEPPDSNFLQWEDVPIFFEKRQKYLGQEK